MVPKPISARGNEFVLPTLAGRRSSRAIRILLLVAAAVAAWLAAARAQQAELDALATRIAGEIAHSKKPHIRKVLVLDFLRSGKRPTELGRVLADEFSKSLVTAARGFEVIDRSRLRAVLEEKKVAPAAMGHEEDAQWLGELAGAQAVVTGSIDPSGDTFLLLIALLETEKGKKLGEVATTLPKSKLWEELLAKEVVPANPSGATAPGTKVFKPGTDGAGYPSCEYCPSPGYSAKARNRKFQGTVVLEVVITTRGRAENIRVLKPAPHGLTEQAIDAVKAWRFKPAMKADGTPVAVSVLVEVTFRLL